MSSTDGMSAAFRGDSHSDITASDTYCGCVGCVCGGGTQGRGGGGGLVSLQLHVCDSGMLTFVAKGVRGTPP
jgi:hypothetical protein